MNRLLLIDGNSLLFRAYYGTAYSSTGVLKNSSGIPVNAVLTFNNMLNKYISKFKPTHIHVAFDTGKKTFRHNKLETYKAGRSEAPEDMKPQWEITKNMLSKMGISFGQKKGLEADDLIGTLATKFKEEEVIILSSDKDFYQLAKGNTIIVSPQNGTKTEKIISFNNIEEHIGVTTEQIVDYKALVGDPSDNLPGVKGIGPKTAVKLLQKYKTIDNIYESINEITNSLQNKLIENKKNAYITKELSIILTNAEYELNIEKMKFNNQITNELIEFYKKYELNSLVKRYEKLIKTEKSDFKNFII